MKAPLRELAHVKASSCCAATSLAVFAWSEDEYAILARELTLERVRAALGPGLPPLSARYELPRLGCLIFPLHLGAEESSWTLRLDGGRQELARRLLELEIEKEPQNS